MASTTVSISEVCAAAQRASRDLATLGSTVKNAALEAIAVALTDATADILEANARDLELGGENGLAPALLDRLALDEGRIAEIAAGVRAIGAQP
jgi:glutamate-5-semialdehyde dehydrogenase